MPRITALALTSILAACQSQNSSPSSSAPQRNMTIEVFDEDFKIFRTAAFDEKEDINLQRVRFTDRPADMGTAAEIRGFLNRQSSLKANWNLQSNTRFYDIVRFEVEAGKNYCLTFRPHGTKRNDFEHGVNIESAFGFLINAANINDYTHLDNDPDVERPRWERCFHPNANEEIHVAFYVFSRDLKSEHSRFYYTIEIETDA